MTDDLNWQDEKTKDGRPVAVLHDAKNKNVVKIYLSPDGAVLRIVLYEMVSVEQVNTPPSPSSAVAV